MSCELTCVLKLGDFLDRVFGSLLFSYGYGKLVIQKLQKNYWLLYVLLYPGVGANYERIKGKSVLTFVM